MSSTADEVRLIILTRLALATKWVLSCDRLELDRRFDPERSIGPA
jgi:hypothetical protein